ncbi:hypothetical protein LZZ85_01745 [Terrimonas sp. NA20]|uniref:Uncharacterized protein n=1 Tax=Terrimonas ginsenosidimutans TaxID=2908004 RepID=A0ABS9KL35_9BACT|nr:hypothetical protein [Terrimonas ginsenosidimutans]MCG2612975.1 hypothetical protein [Terrimonas ginsenosidimutans]
MQTVYLFRILKVICHHNRGVFIFTQLLDEDTTILVKEGSLLKGMSVYHYESLYPYKDDNGSPLLDVFVFRPTDWKMLTCTLFTEGEIVELVLVF